MVEVSEAIAAAAGRHGLSEGAVRALWDALVAGRGAQAQFSHPDLGGMGQWSGGMVQIGDMFNNALKAKVAAACADLALLAARTGGEASSAPFQSQRQGGLRQSNDNFSSGGRSPGPSENRGGPWWPANLGRPSSSGAQNDTRYACFPDQRRLAVERGGVVTVYDTGEHRISGFSQQQSTSSSMAFTSQTGPVMLESLKVVPI